MKRVCIFLTAILCLTGCSESESANQSQPLTRSMQNGAFSLLGTSWTYQDNEGATVLETIDANGDYVSTVGARVVDRGTVKMVNGKACFNSTQSNASPNCWRVPEVAVGETKDYVDNHGQRLSVTRVAHVNR